VKYLLLFALLCGCASKQPKTLESYTCWIGSRTHIYGDFASMDAAYDKAVQIRNYLVKQRLATVDDVYITCYKADDTPRYPRGK
jgi:hypothetical protein